ncbi:MAG: DUF1499 domain-containing protein [Methylobacterium sp.]|nr:DUF1499 domain-containing protein [Methylobacterium sp.]MCA3602528.1 DUF1499 domain-containing protein [Methylobacterium sp.]MCA3613754.1 DUF1499 domain-containing protein [Methylobacterium sp.]
MASRLSFARQSRFTIWAEHLAFVAVPLALLAILLARSGQVDPAQALVLIGLAAFLAMLALAVAGVGAIDMWRNGRTGLFRLFRSIFLALAVLGGPAFLAIEARRLPLLNDITTDLDDPPEFSRSSVALAARKGHVPPVRDPRERERQRPAYPDIRPLVLDMEADQAFRLVREAVQKLRWRIIEQSAPGGRSGQGRIEAIAETTLLRFQDDITIRFRPSPAGTRVDIRSASRIGRHDFGANAKRIRRLAEEILASRD